MNSSGSGDSSTARQLPSFVRYRRVLFVLGALLVVFGLVLCYDLVVPQSVPAQSIPSATSIYIVEYRAPLDLLFPRIYFTVGWVSTETRSNLTVFACGGDPGCSHPDPAPVGFGYGRTGNLSFLGNANEYYLLRPMGGAMTVTVGYTTPVLGGALGFAMLLAGVTLLVVALAGGYRRRRPSAEGPPGPAT